MPSIVPPAPFAWIGNPRMRSLASVPPPLLAIKEPPPSFRTPEEPGDGSALRQPGPSGIGAKGRNPYARCSARQTGRGAGPAANPLIDSGGPRPAAGGPHGTVSRRLQTTWPRSDISPQTRYWSWFARGRAPWRSSDRSSSGRGLSDPASEDARVTDEATFVVTARLVVEDHLVSGFARRPLGRAREVPAARAAQLIDVRLA